MCDYRITYGERAGEEVTEEDVFLTFPSGDVVLEEDAEAFLAENPQLDSE